MKTKQYIKVIPFLLMLVFGVTSCEKHESINDPIIQEFSVNKTNVFVNEEVIFTIDSEADKIVLWTGSEGKNYDERESRITEFSKASLDTIIRYKPLNFGTTISGKYYSFLYSEPGDYTAVLIVRNVQDFTGKYKENEGRIIITVSEEKN